MRPSGQRCRHDAHSRLLQAILGKWHPEQLWLFGSRARGEARGDSDWDLFVVVPDDLDDDELDPVTAWRLRKDAGVRADIVPYHAGDFVRDRDTPNTIAYEIAREGLLLYER